MGLAALSKEDWTPAAVCLMCCGRLIQGTAVQVDSIKNRVESSYGAMVSALEATIFKIGRCRLTVSNLVLTAPMVSALNATI